MSSEVGGAFPYASHLIITKRPTNRWTNQTVIDPSSGQPVDRQLMVNDFPGIFVEFTMYVGNSSIKGPRAKYQFLYRKFFEDELAQLKAPGEEVAAIQAIPEAQRTPTQIKRLAELGPIVADPSRPVAIANVEGILASDKAIWAEDILEEAGLSTDLIDLWEEVYSDALDEFPRWKQDQRGVGIPIYLCPHQWEIRTPWESNKVVSLRIGMYLDEECKTEPAVQVLEFADAASYVNHNMNLEIGTQKITELQGIITGLEADVASGVAGADTKLTVAKSELQRYQADQTARQAMELAPLANLMDNPSIQQSFPQLLMAIIGRLAEEYWPDLDLAQVQTRMAATLAQIQ